MHKDHLGSVRVLATSSGTASSSYDYTYDVTGNTNFSSPMSTFSFTYDPFTQLTMVEDNGGTTNDSLEYGGARQRVFKKTTVSAGQNIVVGGGLSPMLSGPTITTMLYIHGGNDYPIMEKISTGEDKMYVYGPTGLIAMRDNSTWYYVHKDHLGSVRVLATSSGTASSSYDYDVYGKIGRSSVNVDITYKFTGQEFDGETGLYNFRARLYDNTVGVFYAVDPAHENFSQYGYVGGNPVSFVDPTGRVTASSPLIADMIEEGYASFHTPGDPFGNAGGGSGGFNPFSDWINCYYYLPMNGGGGGGDNAEDKTNANEEQSTKPGLLKMLISLVFGKYYQTGSDDYESGIADIGLTYTEINEIGLISSIIPHFGYFVGGSFTLGDEELIDDKVSVTYEHSIIEQYSDLQFEAKADVLGQRVAYVNYDYPLSGTRPGELSNGNLFSMPQFSLACPFGPVTMNPMMGYNPVSERIELRVGISYTGVSGFGSDLGGYVTFKP